MFSELHCKTNFSFLSGASHADELVTRAIELGYHALAITDENTLAGVVKAFGAARKTDLKLIIGAEVILEDAPPLVLWASDRKAYGRLSRLLTVGRKRAAKGECRLRFDDVAELSDGLLAGAIPFLKGDRVRAGSLSSRLGASPGTMPSPGLPPKRLENTTCMIGGNCLAIARTCWRRFIRESTMRGDCSS